MIITLSTGLLRCAFRYDARIVERMKTIPGAAYDKAAREWTVPVANADRVLEAFPLASYDYDALVAAWDAADNRAAIFAACLRRWGIELQIDAAERMVAVGDTVSPLIQDLVAARGEALRRYATAAKSGAVQPPMQPDGPRPATEGTGGISGPRMQPATHSIAQDGWQQARLFA